MGIDPERHTIIAKTLEQWKQQVRDSCDEMERIYGGPVPSLDAAYEVAPGEFSKLIQALVVLAPITKMMPSGELIGMAGLTSSDLVVLR